MARAKLTYKSKAEKQRALNQLNAQLDRIFEGSGAYVKARQRVYSRSHRDGTPSTFAYRAAMDDLQKRTIQTTKAAKNRRQAIMNAAIVG